MGRAATSQHDRVRISIPTGDGVLLAAHHYRAPEEPAPVLLVMTPYRKENVGVTRWAHTLVEAGYGLVVADVRGTGGSAAPYEGLLSPREVDDFVETIGWLAHQSFCDGQVATIGGSYTGINQLLAAARQPPALRCISAGFTPVDTYRDWTHRGGIPSHSGWGAMTYLKSQPADTIRAGLTEYYLDLIAEPLDGALHHERSPESILGRVEVPALITGGWNDFFLRGTIRAFQGAAGPKRLVVGPWSHYQPSPNDELIRWLDHWLRGVGPDPTAGARVSVHESGSDRWLDLDDWPAPSSSSYDTWEVIETPAPVTIRTHVGELPPPPNVPPYFAFDPTASGVGTWGEDLTFDSPVFEQPESLRGDVGFQACVLTSDDGCRDFDLHARLSVVGPDGRCEQLLEGRLRASQRKVEMDRSLLTRSGEIVVPWHPHDEVDPVRPGEPTILHVEMAPACRQMEPGERLRLGLTLVRSDESDIPVAATLMPGTRVLLPLTGARP